MAFCDQEQNMVVQEQFVSYIVQRVLQNRKAELAVLERDTANLEKVRAPFPRVSYDEAVEILKAEGREFSWGDDFGAEDETVLASKYDTPFFVHRYPVACKAFYMKADPARPDVALCADMLAPEGYGEIIGGGQREDDLETLQRGMDQHKMPQEVYSWYVDLRRYGSVPHAGFGMGIERVVAWVGGLDHVRETIPFARMLNRMTP
jgi:asparaginyl-tRNA synthetase